MEIGEWLWHEMEGGMHLLGPQEDTPGYIEGQDQMELCSGDPEQGPGPQHVQEHQSSDVGGLITEHSFRNAFVFYPRLFRIMFKGGKSHE